MEDRDIDSMPLRMERYDDLNKNRYINDDIRIDSERRYEQTTNIRDNRDIRNRNMPPQNLYYSNNNMSAPSQNVPLQGGTSRYVQNEPPRYVQNEPPRNINTNTLNVPQRDVIRDSRDTQHQRNYLAAQKSRFDQTSNFANNNYGTNYESAPKNLNVPSNQDYNLYNFNVGQINKDQIYSKSRKSSDDYFSFF